MKKKKSFLNCAKTDKIQIVNYSKLYANEVRIEMVVLQGTTKLPISSNDILSVYTITVFLFM
jgi:hypothetical protein